jgi:hypothetical protein
MANARQNSIGRPWALAEIYDVYDATNAGRDQTAMTTHQRTLATRRVRIAPMADVRGAAEIEEPVGMSET